MPKEITTLSAVLANPSFWRQLQRFQPSPKCENSVNAKSTHRASPNGKCQLTGALEPLLEWGRTVSEEYASAVSQSPHRDPRQPDGAAPDRPCPQSFGCGPPRTCRERSGRDCDDPHDRRPGAG